MEESSYQIPDPDIPSSRDESAIREQTDFYDPYDQLRRRSSFANEQKLKRVFNACARLLLIVLALALITILIIRVWHLVGPHCLLWLDKDGISEIDQVVQYLIVGSAGPFLFNYFKKNIEN